MSIGTRLRESLRKEPRRFQVQGVRFIEKQHGRAIIGDDMGLGKTYQSIGYLTINPEIRPVVVICPACIKYNWRKELRIHAGLRSRVLNGMSPKRLPPGNIWIINYAILSAWAPLLLKAKPQLLIVDESQYIKNRESIRTGVTVELGRKIPHILALSGTPIENHPVEFFPTLNLIAPKLFPSFWKYAWRYCNPKPGYRGRGWIYKGVTNVEELHRKISRVMIRRMKQDVLKELPPMTRTCIPVEISNREDYEKARDNFLQWLKEKEGYKKARRVSAAAALVRMGTLSRMTGIGKIEAARQWITDFLYSSNEKLVVFTMHKAVMAGLRSTFPKAVVIDGSVNARNRQAAVDQFQNNHKQRLFFGQLKAAGVGLTLTAASTTLFVEIWSTPSTLRQAEDRINRIGQTASGLFAYYLIGKDTVEEKVLKDLDRKLNLIGQVLDGIKEHDNTYQEILDELRKEDLR